MKNEHTPHAAFSEKVRITLMIMAFVLLFLFFLLWRQYAAFQKARGMAALRTQISGQVSQIANLRSRGPLTAADTSYIQVWMTFDYINSTFGVPSGYLESALNIYTPQYPHISIARYAREQSLDPNILVTEIAAAVRTYMASSTVN